MKKTINILRSIITSLLFLILITVTIVQFAFTTIRLNSKNIPDLIDREAVLTLILPNNQLSNQTKAIAINYIDAYINYVFHKRSFPSIQTIDTTSLNETEKKDIEKTLTLIREKIDIKYENVLTLRYINNFLSNGSIYLLINISLLVMVLLLLITTTKIPKTLFLTGTAIIASGLITLITSTIIASIIPKLIDPLVYNLIKNIFDSSLIHKIFNLSLIYILIGFILSASTFITEKVLIKKLSKN